MQFYQNYLLKFRINFWVISSLLISSLICIPIIVILSSFFNEISGYYTLLTETYLYTYIFNTFVLFIGVIFFSFIFGGCCISCIFLYISWFEIFYLGNNSFIRCTRIYICLFFDSIF